MSLLYLFNVANTSLDDAAGYELFEGAKGLRNRWIGAARGLEVVDDPRECWRLKQRCDCSWEEDINVLVATNIIPKAKLEVDFDGDLQQASEGQLRSILDCVARLLKVHARRQQRKAKTKLKK